MSEKLGITLQASMQAGNVELQKLISNLKSAGNEITSIQTKVNKLGEKKYTVKATNGIKNITETINEAGKELKGTTTLTNKSFDTGKLIFYANILRGIWNKFKSIEMTAIDFNETTEKFNVSMGSATNQATNFQNRLAESFGTSRADMMNYQSNFKNVMAGLGTMSSSMAEKVSESLTKMSLDYSSLFNVNQATAANKMQSALVGSIMPIRRESGYDVSKNAVSQKASDLGIDRTYTQLTETEKRLIRIMLLMDQMKNTGAFNDLSRTIESPANQLKVLKNQLQEVQIWLGNVFMGTIGKILPYINGFVMALKEIIKIFAIFVGYEPIATGTDDVLQETSDTVSGISDDLGTATDNAKALKKQLMGFDVLNVITTTSKDTGTNGGVGSIDPKILSALSDYNSLMDSVRMKATDIRDKIMEWLGFEKIIDPITGSITWKLKEAWTWLKTIGAILATIVGLIAIKKVIKLIGYFSKLKGIINGTVDATSNFEYGLASLGKKSGGVSGLATALGKILTIIGGIITMIISLKSELDIIEKVKSGIDDASTSSLKFGTSLASAALGAAAIGAAFGGRVGAAIGLVAGAIAGVAAEIVGLSVLEGELSSQAETDSKKIQKTWEDENTLINDSYNLQLKNITSAAIYKDKLADIVDENGKVKEGYERIASTLLSKINTALGTSYTLSGNVIKLNGEQITSYQQIANTIDDIIAKKKQEIKIEADEARYKNAIQEQADALYKLKEAQDKLKEARKNGNQQAITDAQNAVIILSTEYDKMTKKVADSNNLMIQDQIDTTNSISSQLVRDGIVTTDEYKKILDTNKSNWNATYQALSDSDKAYMLALSTDVDNFGPGIKSKWLDLATGSTENFILGLNNVDATSKEKLLQMITDQKGLNPQIEAGWANLAQNNKNKFEDGIKDLPEEQKLILEGLNTNVEDMSPYILQSYADLAKNNKDEYNKVLSSLPQDTQNKLNETVNKINSNSYSFNRSGSNIGSNISQGAESNTNINIDSSKIHFDETGIRSKSQSLGSRIGNWLTSTIGNIKFNITGSGIHSSYGWFADGGFPDTGQMFIARESGPELVGKIGNQTAVANNQQIVQAVSQGVAQAVKATIGNNNGGSYNLYLDGKQLTDVVQKRILRNNNISGN